MSWILKEKLQKRLENEQGASVFAAGQRNAAAFMYPNSYYVGMSNLGLHILYQLINARKDTACERVFMPERDEEKEYVRTNTALMSIENQRPLYDFSLICISISFEMDYFNLLRMLELGKVRLLAAERREREPLLIAGGPCATFNPEPLSNIIDVFVIGEGEQTLMNILDVYYQKRDEGLARIEILKELSQLPGVYVPRFYQHSYNEAGRLTLITSAEGAPARVKRQWITDLDKYEAHTVIETMDTEFKNLYLVETARGCGRHCRFCMAGYCFRKPRNRSLERLAKTITGAKAYGKKIGLMGAAISDYPQVNELCHIINDNCLPMSVASFRADSVTEELVDSLAKSGLKTLTLAPEAGSIKLRNVINKGITDEHLFNAVDYGIKAGIMNYRLYIMVGLPFETDEDIDAIIDMAKRLKEYMLAGKSKGILTLSINPFISKPFTPFQWLPMEQMKTVDSRLKKIKNELKKIKNIDVIIESPKEAYIQGVLARGDRRISQVLYDAHCMGGSKAFKRAMKQNNIDEADYLYRQRDKDEVFPWDALDMGVTREYLYSELDKARRQAATIRCFDGCKRCGVCK